MNSNEEFLIGNEKPKKYLNKGIVKLLFFYMLIIELQISGDIKKEKQLINIICEPNKVKPKNKSYKADNLKVALCTMGKRENLYVKEFVEYYYNLGLDKMFIYDDNEPNTEKISDMIDNEYKQFVTVYDNIKDKIKNQGDAFTDCYQNNLDKYDWFLMVDMDEFLYIINSTLKDYLVNTYLNKCDFIKFHWIVPSDNDLIHYDNRTLFERFKGPYKKSKFIKSIIRGNITDLKYWVHSPSYSPKRNITCNNIGQIIRYERLNFEFIEKINVEKAFIIHFRFKSTEELISKFKRGYSNWFGSRLQGFVKASLNDYFKENNLTLEKIEYVEKELNVNLLSFKINYYLSKIIYFF